MYQSIVAVATATLSCGLLTAVNLFSPQPLLILRLLPTSLLVN